VNGKKWKKLVAGWLVLAGLYAPVQALLSATASVGEVLFGVALGVPLVLLGRWLWRSLPPWRELNGDAFLSPGAYQRSAAATDQEGRAERASAADSSRAEEGVRIVVDATGTPYATDAGASTCGGSAALTPGLPSVTHLTQTRKRVLAGTLGALALLCLTWALLLTFGLVESGRTILVQGFQFPVRARAVDILPWVFAGVLLLGGALYAVADEIDRRRSKR
jgi:hypothetical protein